MKKLLTILFLLLTVGVIGQTVTPVILPQYIQGVGSNNDADDKRIPFVARVTLSGLIPSTEYRYNHRFAASQSLTGNPAIDDGQGNMIIPNSASAFVRITSLNLSSVNGSGAFTTDANGTYTGWFISEPRESNAIFLPGNQIFWRILLNNGAGGPDVATRLTISLPITVLQWDGYNPYVTPPFPQAGFMGESLIGSNAAYLPKNLIFLYDNVAGTGRPIAGTYVESDALSNLAGIADPNFSDLYADFYESVPIDGITGAWGTIIPSNLATGVRNVKQYSLTTGSPVTVCTSANGDWDGTSTVSQVGFDHTNPIFIDCTPATVSCTGSVTGTQTNVNCFGQSTGAINISVTGAAPFTYSWSNGATTEDLSGIPVGTYSVEVTDASSCIYNATFVITQPASGVAASAVASNISCFGQTNGSINLTVTGGTPPYSYSWNNGAITEDLSGLAAGTYSVVVTDASGCTANASATVVQPTQLTISVLAPAIPNCGTSTTISISAVGGTGPYTGTGTFTRTEGTYTFTITDANGCTASSTVTVAPAVCVTVAEVLYPQFVQGVGSGTASADRKVPYATRLTLNGLNPGATYRFFSRFTDDPNDASNGVGNFIVVNQAGNFTRVPTGSLSNPGGYGEFTANGSGSYTGWFVVEPTSDPAFQPGNQLFFRIILNDGAGGGSPANRVSPTNFVTVLGFGATATDGSFLWGATNPFFSAKNFVMLYNNVAGTGRPLSGTFIEDDGTANTAVNGYAPAYDVNVNTQNSRWGTIIPNNLANGINNISQYSLATGSFVNSCTSSNGQYNNVNSVGTTGTTATANANWGETADFTSANPRNIICTDCNLALSSTQTNVLCFGASTGAINLSVSGAAGSPTFAWSGPNGFSATSEDISNLAAGTYTVVITDINPTCTATRTIIITQPAAAIAPTAVATASTCGASNGSVNLTVTGGTPIASTQVQALSQNFDVMGSSAAATIPSPFRVSSGIDWSAGTSVTTVAYGTTGTGVVGAASAGGTANWANGVTASSTDRALGFLTSGTFTSPRSIILKIDNTSGVTVSQLNISFDYEKYRNGTRAYDWTFFHGSTSSPSTAASAGNESYAVNAANTVVNPPTSIAKSFNLTGLSIPTGTSYYLRWTFTGVGGSTNSQGIGVDNVNVSLLASNANYTYLWSNGATTENISGLAAGPYSVTITDGNGCTATANATVNDIAGPTLLATSTSVTTIGGSDGTASVTASGGTSPYSYLWSPGGQTTATATGLSAGNYSVLVTDANGCTATATTTVGSPACNVQLSFTQSNVSCFGGSTGTATVTATNTSGTVSYVWNNGQTTATATGLSAGTYSVTVTDGAGCTATGSVTITQPASALAASAVGTGLTCATTGNNGSIALTVSGGTAPYTYLWSNGATTQNLATLAAGTYSVVVTDASGCTATASATIIVRFAASATVVNSPCGYLDGTITISAVGGVLPYTGTGTFVRTPGSYSFTVTDGSGCSRTVTARVTGPLVASSNAGIIPCGETTTTVTVTASQGVAPYSGIGTFTVPAGPYSFTVTDANGCTTTTAGVIAQPACYTVTPVYYPKYVQGVGSGSPSADTKVPYAARMTVGGLTASTTYRYYSRFVENPADASNGVGTYILVNGSTFTRVTSASLSTAGRYAEFTTNASGNYTGWFVVEPSSDPSFQPGNQLYWRLLLNDGAGGGSVVARITAGESVSVLGFGSSAGQGTGLRSTASQSLTAKNFIMLYNNVGGTGRPESGTFIESDGTVNNVAAGYASFYANNVDGVDKTWGSIIPNNLSNGINNITQYALSNGSFVSKCTSLTGVYGSTGTANANGGLTTPLVISTCNDACASIVLAASVTNVSCSGGENGAIDLTVTGATAPITYSWSNGATIEDLVGLIAGTYTVNITDATGCTAAFTATVTEPSVLVASSSATIINCNGGSSTITISATGGTAPYTGTGTFTRTQGTYTFSVTDANGCTAVTTISISEPAALVASSSSTIILCNGGSSTVTVSASGGTAPYTGTGSFIRTAGTYTFVVTDARGCTAEIIVTLQQPTLLVATSSAGIISCNGGSTTVTVAGSGGTPPYAGTGDFIRTSGTYSFTVTDANGCTKVTTITISQPAVLAATATSTAANSGSNGTATVTASGGTAPYTYLWSAGGQTTQTITGLSSGTYTVTVTDVNGCTATATTTVTSGCGVVANAGPDRTICTAGENVTLTGSASGGNTRQGKCRDYTFRWTRNGVQVGTTASITVNTAGTYVFTATDCVNCVATDQTVVTASTLATTAAVGTPINCFGGSTTVTVSATGGTAPYTGTGTFTRTAGTYTFTVTDAAGCSRSVTVTIAQPTQLAASATSTPVSVVGGSNGTATVMATGGTAPYTYLWSPGGQTTATATGLTAGPYTVTVTDSRGCTASATTTVGSPQACNILVTATAGTIPCFGESTTVTVSATGGTAPYTGTGTFTRTAGTYEFTVTDAAGCSATSSVTITQPAQLVASATAPQIPCGGTTTTVTVTATGGTAPYTGTGTFSRAAGTWSFTVTDSRGCTSVATVVVTAASCGPVDPTKCYRITVRVNNTSASVDNGNTNDGTPLKNFNYNGNPWQIFKFTPVGGGYYLITDQNSGKVVGVQQCSLSDDKQLEIQTKVGVNGSDCQQWSLTSAGAYFYITNKLSGKVWTAAGSIQQKTLKNGNRKDQEWSFIEVACPVLTRTEVQPKYVKEVTEEESSETELTVSVSPNPGVTFFNLSFNSKDKTTPVSVRVIDVNGRQLSIHSKIAVSETLRIKADRWAGGTYFAEVIQGDLRKVVKMIRAN